MSQLLLHVHVCIVDCVIILLFAVHTCNYIFSLFDGASNLV